MNSKKTEKSTHITITRFSIHQLSNIQRFLGHFNDARGKGSYASICDARAAHFYHGKYTPGLIIRPAKHLKKTGMSVLLTWYVIFRQQE